MLPDEIFTGLLMTVVLIACLYGLYQDGYNAGKKVQWCRDIGGKYVYISNSCFKVIFEDGRAPVYVENVR